MRTNTVASLSFAAALMLAATGAFAQPGDQGREQHGRTPAAPAAHGRPAGPAGRGAEPHPGPSGYQRVMPPQGWNARPNTVNRGAYQHNYQANQTFSIGPYHPPVARWAPRRWAYGQILPRQYWGRQYVIGDYWLFALAVPPVGYEWVRYGNDALLINMATGEILQVVYDRFG